MDAGAMGANVMGAGGMGAGGMGAGVMGAGGMGAGGVGAGAMMSLLSSMRACGWAHTEGHKQALCVGEAACLLWRGRASTRLCP